MPSATRRVATERKRNERLRQARTTLRFVCLGVVLVMAALSVSGPALGEGEPSFEELAAREQPFQTDRPFVAPDDQFRVLLPFPLAAEPTVEGAQISFSLDPGTGALVNCFAHLDALDPAMSAAAVGMASLPVGAEDPPIVAREIHDIDIFHVDHEVVIATDWLYTVQRGGDQLTGMFKIRAASLGLGGLLCLHEQVGYSDTFDRIMEHLLRSWVGKGDDVVTPIFYELSVTRLNDMPVSVDRLTISVDEDGDYVIRSLTSDLTPVDSATLAGEETYAVEYAYPSGELINSIVVTSDSSQVSEQLNLNAEDDSTWTVTGTFQSKPMDHRIEHGPLNSELLERRRIRRFLGSAKAGERMAGEIWLPDADPTTITKGEIEYVERRGDAHRVKIAIGELELDAEIDESGSLVRAVAEVAGATVEMERIYLSGVFPDVPLDD